MLRTRTATLSEECRSESIRRVFKPVLVCAHTHPEAHVAGFPNDLSWDNCVPHFLDLLVICLLLFDGFFVPL